MALNKLISDFKTITNTRLALIRDVNIDYQRTCPEPIPTVSVAYIPENYLGTRIYESEAKVICNGFRDYYQQQGYKVNSTFDAKTRHCTLQFADVYTTKHPRPKYAPKSGMGPLI